MSEIQKQPSSENDLGSGSSGDAVDKENSKKPLVSVHDEIRQEAESLISGTLPLRILQLEKLLASPRLNVTQIDCRSEINVPRPSANSESDTSSFNGDMDGSEQPRTAFGFVEAAEIAGTKVLALPGDGVVAINATLTELYALIKPLITQLVHDCIVLKMWIKLLIPKVEDGHNFGVGIQEECLNEVWLMQACGVQYFDRISMYYLARGKIVASILKNPHIEEFRRAIDELDQRNFFAIRMTVMELRNHYMRIHDVINKNLDKIRQPRVSYSLGY